MDAASGALRRTIPNAYHSVGATTEIDLSALPITHGAKSGKKANVLGAWITLQNKTGAAIAVNRDVTGVALPVAGQALSIEDGAKEDFYVEIDPTLGTFLRASAAGLLISFDTNALQKAPA